MTNLYKISDEMKMAIRLALKEDIGSGDVTTDAIVPVEAFIHGHIISKQKGIVSGLGVARAVYLEFDETIKVKTLVEEGAPVNKGDELLQLDGSARSLLTAERTALNFLGRMSGISTATHQYVEAVNGTKAQILDTRKTVPGLREFDKLAVKLGGGSNHRIGLYDMILIKDNHIDFAGSITKAVNLARAAGKGLKIEVEARTLADVEEALSLNVQRIMLDNMTCSMMHEAVIMVNGQTKLEASGNITLENVRQAAETGVDFISIGALTHSVVVFDVSFDYLAKVN
jgi:nicotinate-nucleotide pyrophosphorylase (carboxylating)